MWDFHLHLLSHQEIRKAQSFPKLCLLLSFCMSKKLPQWTLGWGIGNEWDRESAPENHAYHFCSHSERTGTELLESHTQSGSLANSRGFEHTAILQQLLQLHSLNYNFIWLELISYNWISWLAFEVSCLAIGEGRFKELLISDKDKFSRVRGGLPFFHCSLSISSWRGT